MPQRKGLVRGKKRGTADSKKAPGKTPVKTPAKPGAPVTVVYAVVGPKVALQNTSSVIKDSELDAVVAAINKQVNEHFSLPPPHGFGIGVQLRALHPGMALQEDEWHILLTDKVDVDGAYGYHDETRDGHPFIRIFPQLDLADGVHWSSVVSHELLETLIDPNIAKCAQGIDGEIWAYEVCGPVEADYYLIDGVKVSNFVLPAYFETPQDISKLKLDYLGLLKKPLEIRPGGYNLKMGGDGTWTEIFASKLPRDRRQLGIHDELRGRTTRRREKCGKQ